MRFDQIDSWTRPQWNLWALFLSDLHLGARNCKSDRIIEFRGAA